MFERDSFATADIGFQPEQIPYWSQALVSQRHDGEGLKTESRLENLRKVASRRVARIFSGPHRQTRLILNAITVFGIVISSWSFDQSPKH